MADSLSSPEVSPLAVLSQTNKYFLYYSYVSCWFIYSQVIVCKKSAYNSAFVMLSWMCMWTQMSVHKRLKNGGLKDVCWLLSVIIEKEVTLLTKAFFYLPASGHPMRKYPVSRRWGPQALEFGFVMCKLVLEGFVRIGSIKRLQYWKRN